MRNFIILLIVFFYSINVAICEDMTFVQVEGCLLSTKNVESVQRLETLVEKINKHKNVEFVVFTGNNISKPTRENLEKFLEIANKLNFPYYVTIGNKDINKQRKFGKVEYVSLLQKKVKKHKKISSTNYVFIKNGVVFIVVDGSKEFIPSAMGYYKDDVLNWLEQQLIKNVNKNVVIIQHFPIIPPVKKETHYTYKADEYLKLLSKYSNVKAIISGHFDVNSEKEYNSIWHITTKNAPQYRIIDILDYNTNSPVFWSILKR